MAITFQVRTICRDHTRSFTNIIFPFYRAENWAQDFTNGNHCLPSLRYIPSFTNIFMPQGSCVFVEDRTGNEHKAIFSCFVWVFIFGGDCSLTFPAVAKYSPSGDHSIRCIDTEVLKANKSSMFRTQCILRINSQISMSQSS